MSHPLKHAVMDNRILARLPRELFERIESRLERVELEAGTTLFQAFEPFRYIYFLTTATVSLVALTRAGATLEICSVGCEGIVGIAAILGGASTYGAVVQVSGEALRMRAVVMRDLFRQYEPIRNAVLHYVDTRLKQVSQAGVCNRFHTVTERLARWLLELQDRTGLDSLPLTHDLVSAMLGARRASVTVAAASLRKARLIRYGRGEIHITDRPGLERRACECYPLLKRRLDMECA